jgi:PST family polysaccharide transporter
VVREVMRDGQIKKPLEAASQNMPQLWLVTAASNAAVLVVQIVSMAILARALAPDNFGIIAMVMAILGVASIVQDLGLSAATVRVDNLSDSQSTAILGINILFGAAATVIATQLSPLVGEIYNNPEIVPIAMALSLNFIFSALGAQHLALIRRSLRFVSLAKINLTAVIFGQGVAIALAFSGHEYWALTIGLLLTTLTKSLLGWVAGSFKLERPSFDENIRKMISFGGWLTVFSIMGYVAMHIHSVLLGSQFGAEQAGLYGRAFALYGLATGLITAPLITVVPSILAKLKSNIEQYRRSYFDTLEMQILLMAPLGALCFLCAPQIVMIILGDGWKESIAIFEIISLAAIPQAICASSGWLYMSNGDTKSMMLWGLGGWSTLILLLIVGVQWGGLGLAISYVLGMYVLTYPCMRLAFRKSKATFKQLWCSLAPVVMSSILSGCATSLLLNSINVKNNLASISIATIVFAIIYLMCLVFVFRKSTMLKSLLFQLSGRLALGR